MSFKKTALAGFFWTFLERFGIQAIMFIVSIIVARILSPEEFGLIGMLAIFMAVGRTMIDSGLTQSLIRDESVTEVDYSTVFFFNLFASILIYITLFVSAPYIAEFYNEPKLSAITRVYCFSFVINAFSTIQLTKLSRELDFKTQIIVSIPSQVISGMSGIILAYLGFGVWSLVYMSLIQSAASTVQIWWRVGWIPKLIFDKAKFKHHLDFGYKIGVSSLLTTIFGNMYHLVIGKYFSAGQLGFFTQAAKFKDLPVQTLSAALNKVTYPLFATIQKDDVKLKVVYKQIMTTVIFFVAPCLLLLSALAEPTVNFLLTEKWLPIVPLLQVMCFGGILTPIHTYNLNILKVKGRSDLYLRLEVIKRVVFVITLMISFQFGVMGIIWGQFINSVIYVFINTYYSGKFINYAVIEQLKDITPILLLSGSVAGAIFYLNLFLQVHNISAVVRLFICGPLGIVVYLAAAWGMKINSFTIIKNIILRK